MLKNTIEQFLDPAIGPSYKECSVLAKNILENWYRLEKGIKTSYEHGNF